MCMAMIKHENNESYLSRVRVGKVIMSLVSYVRLSNISFVNVLRNRVTLGYNKKFVLIQRYK